MSPTDHGTAEVRAIVADVLLIDQHEVQLESTMETLPDWDSLATVQIVMRVESTLGVRLSYKDIADIRSVQDLVNLVTPS
jgi:acyl carrier protein